MAQLTQNKAQLLLSQMDNSEFLPVLDQYNDGVMIVDHEGTIIYYNRAMCRIDELEPELALFYRVTDVYDLDNDTSLIMQCLKQQAPIIDKPFYYRTLMGKFANTIHSVFPLFQKGKMAGAICFVRDYNVIADTLANMHVPESHKRTMDHQISFADIIGQDTSFVKALDTARMAATTPSPVMLYGETGTGKELFAMAIHNYSLRADKKFTPINCSAIPENLLEGILFGTSKGAFTGAVNKAGLFERTSQGTILLDELNSMPLGLQSKILRVVQDGKVRRVGALRETKFDVKIVSSLNQDPHKAIASGNLRSDLFYRLGVVFIHIVPLRQRLGDLEALIHHFIRKHNSRLGKQVLGVSREVMNMFLNYQWPGNVRELEHVIEGSMHMMGSHEHIRMRHLPPHFPNIHAAHFLPSTSPVPAASAYGLQSSHGHDNTSLLLDKQAQENRAISQALARLKGNITQTAKALGISRQLLYYKMKKYNLSRKDFQ